MHCEHARPRLHELADRRSLTVLSAELAEHLHACDDCRHLYGTLIAFESLFTPDRSAAPSALPAPFTPDTAPRHLAAPDGRRSADFRSPSVPPHTARDGEPGVSDDFVERVWTALRTESLLSAPAPRPSSAAVGMPVSAAASLPDSTPPASPIRAARTAHRTVVWLAALALCLAALPLLTGTPTATAPAPSVVRHVSPEERPGPPSATATSRADLEPSILELAPRAPLMAAALSADAGLRIAESTQRMPDELGRRLAQTVLTLPRLLENAGPEGDTPSGLRGSSAPSPHGSDARPLEPLQPLLRLFRPSG
ncbi:MAG: hypothetical protein D6725_14375 [Planctomycetota bacterium]|nr:MAG: hypothetical protein D6725_14375 [Planctomycetota bacterium]